MKKITLLLFTFLITNQLYSQSLFNRIWGNSGNILTQIRIATAKPNTDELYVNYETDHFGSIYVYNNNTGTHNLFYQLPQSTPPQGTGSAFRFENMVFDSNNNLIVYGRTHNANLGTANTYSPIPFPYTSFTGHTFIAKISPEKKLVWITYFHDLVQSRNNLAIDKNNNIYVLNYRHKNDVLSPSYFKSKGDSSSNRTYQEVISKISPNGQHLWSTFYFNDESEINSIVASDDGLFVYGVYLGSNPSNTYFSTTNSYQETPSNSGSSEKSVIFLTKHSIDSKRSWRTYFGTDIIRIPINYTSFPQSLIAIGKNAYFLATHTSVNSQTNNITTPNCYLNSAPDPTKNTILTKFNGDGKRDWTTYLYAGQALQKNEQNELVVTASIYETNPNILNLTTLDAYQPIHGGKTDIYTSILSNNGKTLKYGSFYGFAGEDNG